MTGNLYVTPSTSVFDVERIRHWLDSRADAFEVSPNIYRIAESPTYADMLYAKSLENRSSTGTFVRVQPDEILVENEGDTPSLRSAIDFLEWLSATHDVRFRTGWSGERDITEALRAHGVAHHYEDRIRSTELAWQRQLREIGFFHYLDHGHDTSVSVEQARRDTALAEEPELISYLESGRLYRAGDTLMPGDDGALGLIDVLTDGVYLWPSDLPQRVKREHVRLPRHFMIHARENGWRVPAIDLATLPGSENVPRLTAHDVAWYTRPTIAPTTDGPTCSLMIAHGLATTGQLLCSGGADAVYRGYTRRGTSVLVTFTMRHEESLDELSDRLRFEHDGIATLLHIGAVDPASGRGFRDELVEMEPTGRSILDRVPLPEQAVIRCGIEVAAILESFHQNHIALGGLAPEMIYVDDALRFTQLTPRSRRFVASVELRSGGLRSYKVPYSGHEALVLGRGSDEEGDVFALGASLFHAATGEHPFGASLPEIFQRVTTNTPLRYPGSPALGAILASTLEPDPNKRPSALELASGLARLT